MSSKEFLKYLERHKSKIKINVDNYFENLYKFIRMLKNLYKKVKENE